MMNIHSYMIYMYIQDVNMDLRKATLPRSHSCRYQLMCGECRWELIPESLDHLVC